MYLKLFAVNFDQTFQHRFLTNLLTTGSAPGPHWGSAADLRYIGSLSTLAMD